MKRMALVLAVIAVAATSCGNAEPDRDLSPRAAEGRAIALDKGCAACHGDNGEGGVGPAWVGLAGSDVELADGSVVRANREYLRLAIVEPESQILAGVTIAMPKTSLTDDEVDALIAYIEELR